MDFEDKIMTGVMVFLGLAVVGLIIALIVSPPEDTSEGGCHFIQSGKVLVPICD